MNGIYNYFPKAQQVAFDRGNLVPEKAIFRSVTVYNKNLSSQCNLNAQIEKVQDKS